MSRTIRLFLLARLGLLTASCSGTLGACVHEHGQVTDEVVEESAELSCRMTALRLGSSAQPLEPNR